MLYYDQRQRTRVVISSTCVLLVVAVFCAAFGNKSNSFRLLMSGNEEARLRRVVIANGMREDVYESDVLLRYLEQCVRQNKTEGFFGDNFIGSTQELVFVGGSGEEFVTCGVFYENGMAVHWPAKGNQSSWEGYSIEDCNLWIPFVEPRPLEWDEMLTEAFPARELTAER